MSEYAYIYELIDPRTNEPRYVGKAKDVDKRFKQHLWEAKVGKKGKRLDWIRDLANENLVPKHRIIMKVPYERWGSFERRAIAVYWENGINLLNRHKGGQGLDHISDETREKLSRASKERWADPDWREKMVRATRKGMSKPETRELLSRLAIERNSRPDIKEASRQRLIERWQDEEYAQEMREAAKARGQDPEFIQKCSESAIKSWTPERRAQQSGYAKEMWASPEFKEKMIAIAHERWADPEYQRKQSESNKAAYRKRMGLDNDLQMSFEFMRDDDA